MSGVKCLPDSASQWQAGQLSGVNKNGFSLIEAILAGSLFVLIVTTLVGGLIYARESLAISADREQATMLAEEGIEVVRNIKEEDFANLVDGTHGLTIASNQWQFSGAFDTVDKFTRQIDIATVDSDTKQVTAQVTWQQNQQRTGSIALTSYLSNWSETGSTIAQGIAWLQGSQTSAGIDINQASAVAFEWSDYDYDPNFYDFSVSNPTRLIVKQNGDYLIAITLPMERTDVNNSRTRLEVDIRVNGVKQTVGVGRSSFIRNAGSHGESSDHLHALLTGLSANDYIEVFVQAVTTVDSGDQVIVSGLASLYAEYIPTGETVFSAVANQTTSGTNFNLATPAELVWQEGRKDSGYAHSDSLNPAEIMIDEIGDYLVLVNIPLAGSVSRANLVGRVLLNGSQIAGGRFKQGYIRNSEGDTEASIHWSGTVQTTGANQILSIDVGREAGNGTITAGGELATIYLQKLPSDDIYFATATDLTNGTNWNPASPGQVLWTTDAIIDTNIYSHNTGVAAEAITVNQAGDYLLAYNDSLIFGSGTARPNALIEVLINDASLSGAQTKSHYIRNQSGHIESSGSLVYFLHNLSAGDQIKVQVSQEASSGSLNDDEDAIIMLWRKELLGGASCSCGDWNNDVCAGNACSLTQMHQTRTCTPAGCNFESQCLDDSCSAWINQSCAGNSCGATQMYQTRSCIYGCGIEEQCLDDSCGAWASQSCGGGSCTATQMQQVRSCTYSCDIEEQCLDDSYGSWANQSCAGNSCNVDEMYQTQDSIYGCLSQQEQCNYDDCGAWGAWYCEGGRNCNNCNRCRDRSCEFGCQIEQECEFCTRCRNGVCR